MTMNDPRDPRVPRDPYVRDPYIRDRGNTGIGWAFGAIAALAILGLMAWSMSDNVTTASRDNAPITTTGQGQREPVPAPNPAIPERMAPTPAPAR